MNEGSDRVQGPTRAHEVEHLLRRKMELELREWVQSHVKQALDSFNHDVVANSEDLQRQLAGFARGLELIDRILRGEKGDNGLSSEIRSLREAETRRSKREWAVIGLLIAAVAERVFSAIT